MTPFLEKLRLLCTNCSTKVAGWSSDGKEFEVRNPDLFEEYLKEYFKGTLKTFVRQLHFYGFKKSEVINRRWCFSHPKFSCENLDGVLEITRKTRVHPISFASKTELKELKKEMEQLKRSFKTHVQQMNSRFSSIMDMLAPEKKRMKRAESSRSSQSHQPYDSRSNSSVKLEPQQFFNSCNAGYLGVGEQTRYDSKKVNKIGDVFSSGGSRSGSSTPPAETLPEFLSLFPISSTSIDSHALTQNAFSTANVTELSSLSQKRSNSSSSVATLTAMNTEMSTKPRKRKFNVQKSIPPGCTDSLCSQQRNRQSGHQEHSSDSVFRFDDYPLPIQDLSFNNRPNWK